MLSMSKNYCEANEVYIKKIREASELLLENINKIVDVSRIETGDIKFLFERISIKELIEEIINELAVFIKEKNMS